MRWFVLPVAFAYLAAAAWMATALDAADGRRRAIALVAVAAFAAGNAYRLALLARDGRGDYRAAVRYLAEHEPSAEIRIGSDHDFRNRLLLRYYGGELPEGRTLVYVPQLRKLASWPPWVLAHRYGARPDAPGELRDPEGHRYEAVAAWRSSDLSGFRWTLYRRAESAAMTRGLRETPAPRGSRRWRSCFPSRARRCHVDDPLFVWTAQQIQRSPLDFYGFDVLWLGERESMATREPEPAGCELLPRRGRGDRRLRRARAPPRDAPARGGPRARHAPSRAGARRAREVGAALLLVSFPAFLVSATSLMTDVLAAALWTWASRPLARGAREGRSRSASQPRVSRPAHASSRSTSASGWFRSCSSTAR